MSWSLAIDFGTSNTAAAYRLGSDKPLPVRLSDQAEQMPSAVLALESGILVGTAAVRSARLDPARYEPNPKRRVGEGEVLLGDREYSVTELVAAVLAQVRYRAERVAGNEPLTRLVLTYPEQWAAHRRDVLRQAAIRAGFAPQVIDLQSEPVAAASWYASVESVRPGDRVGVFDFGGGTCDVAVLRAGSQGGFDVLAAAGADPLGGEHLDQRLLDWTLGQLTRNGNDMLRQAMLEPANLAALLTLREQVRQAKHELSDYESARIPVALGAVQTIVTITSTEFDALIAPDIDAAMALTANTLRSAGTAPNELRALYLTGGSSHLRLVHRRMTELLGRPPATLNDPKLVVAQGALSADRSVAGPTAAGGQAPPTGGIPMGGPPTGGSPLSVAPPTGATPIFAGPPTGAAPIFAGPPTGAAPVFTGPPTGSATTGALPPQQGQTVPADRPGTGQPTGRQPLSGPGQSAAGPYDPNRYPPSGAAQPTGSIPRPPGPPPAPGSSSPPQPYRQPSYPVVSAPPGNRSGQGLSGPPPGGFGGPPAPGPSRPSGPHGNSRRRGQILATVIAAVVVVAIVLGFTVFRPSGDTPADPGGQTTSSSTIPSSSSTSTSTTTSTTRSTSTTTTTSEGVKSCWDGKDVAVSEDCPPIDGVDGLTWVWGVDDGVQRDCELSTDASLAAPGEDVLVKCTFKDLPDVTMWLSKWDSVDSIGSNYQSWTKSDWTVTGGVVVGDRYEHRDSTDGTRYRLYAYGDYPYSALLICNDPKSENVQEIETADTYMVSRKPDVIGEKSGS